MDILELRSYCLSKPGVTEEFPFDKDTLVFKVMGKMFVLAGLERWERGEEHINLKCDPKKAIELRMKYPDSVTGGFHANKKHWNTVTVNKDLSDGEVRHWINHSYELVVAKLTKKSKEQLKELSR
jgi:predicted DNA-binding protein (MmcQ/YjbR family)